LIFINLREWKISDSHNGEYTDYCLRGWEVTQCLGLN
jgi:hypothetical protein